MLTIEYAKDPVWANAENTLINLTVKFEEMANELPFTASPNDSMPYGVVLYNNAVASDYGTVAPYVIPQAPTP
jgi:hypothetical protein